jgi:RNA polymerase sigma-70 factor (ECF subfamily)
MRSVAGPGGPEVNPAGTGARRSLSHREFARLYQEHWGALWCVAAGVLGDRSLAQDAVQQAALIGLGRLDQFEVGTSFLAWMGTIVKNTALNDARKRQRQRIATDHVDGPSLKPPALVSLAIDGFDRHLLTALEQLEETARSCLLMRIVADMPYKQIALALDIPEGTAASHVHRARAYLRNALDSESDAHRATTGRAGTGGLA